MKPQVLTITLNPAIDKTVSVPGFKIGRDFREKAISLSAGGKGINVSRALKYLGIPNIAGGFLGGASGNYIRQKLNQEGIKNNFYSINGNSRTSLTVIDPLSAAITRVLERGPKISKKELSGFRKQLTILLGGCRYLILSGRNIPGAGDSLYAQLIALAKRKKILSVLDTSGKAYLAGIKQGPFMVKPNLQESEKALNRKISSLKQVKQACLSFQRKGIKIVAITMGSRGAVVYNGKETLLGRPPKLKRISPVGCGDAFISGFIASCLRKESLAKALRLAVACGAANALSLNPGFINQATVRRISKQVKIEKI